MDDFTFLVGMVALCALWLGHARRDNVKADLPYLRERLATVEWSSAMAAALDEIEELRAFVDKAFIAHPNLDIDVENVK